MREAARTKRIADRGDTSAFATTMVRTIEGRNVGNATAAERVVAFFEALACEEGWRPSGELRTHLARSTYFALTCRDSSDWVVVGALQLVRPDAEGRLPCLRVWPELEPELAGRCDIAHVAVLAVDRKVRGVRGGAPFWLLCARMWRTCVQDEVRELWLEATPPVLRAYRLLGWPLVVRGELREHWGEPCYPCSLAVREVAGSLTERAIGSALYRRILAEMVGSRLDTVDGDGATGDDESV